MGKLVNSSPLKIYDSLSKMFLSLKKKNNHFENRTYNTFVSEFVPASLQMNWISTRDNALL